MPDRSAAPQLPSPEPRTAWAKSLDGTPSLSLTDHSVDVGAMAEAILSLPTIRDRLGRLAGRRLSGTDIARLSFFAGLHDFGKAVHSFQRRLRDGSRASHIAPAWALLGSDAPPSVIRTEVRRALKRGLWKSWFADSDAEAALWDVVLAHHGSLPPERPAVNASDWRSRNGYDPLAALAEVVPVLEEMFPNAFSRGGDPLPTPSRFLHALAGLVVLADWLGSNHDDFPFPNEGGTQARLRIASARAAARNVIGKRWWDPLAGRAAARELSLDFHTLFPKLGPPRPAQRALLEQPLPRSGQIVALEAETGSGKTEAALIHFLRLFREGEVDGMYFALPTRAAAVQIHTRIKKVIARWFGDAAPPVGLAVPGYLRVDDREGHRPLPETWRVLWDDERVRERGWAVENAKRYLSGAVMIGTIDQALLGGLRVRHAQMRSGPMLRLLLVVDEVHASDAYMTTLLRNLLDQHSAAGGHALLMSATLGSSARERLLQPSRRIEMGEIQDVTEAARLPYPSVSRSGEPLHELAVDGRSKRVRVELVDPDSVAEDLFCRIREAAEAGAVVLFIRNRVDDAQDTVERLEALGARLFVCEGVVAPHHGRFAPEDRRLLDAALEEALGKRREGVVAVTTQTAEQSLDICADWLITDLAPGDVLLQRIGRLHRHADNLRPPGYEEPVVTVVAPSTDRLEGLLRSDGNRRRGRSPLGLGRIYENIVGLRATRDWLAERGEIQVPRDNRELVEAATHGAGLEAFAQRLGGPWQAHLGTVLAGRSAEGTAASAVKIRWKESLVANQPIREIKAATRLGLMDRRLDLPEPLPGPFGTRVRTLAVPGWMAEGIDPDAEPTEIQAGDRVIRFRLGRLSFLYDRLGLRRVGS